MQVQVPVDTQEVCEMVREIHNALAVSFAGHIDAQGHSVLSLQEEKDIILGKKYMDVLGKSGATFYLWRKFCPEKFPNWGVNNEGIMNAFYHKKSLKLDGTIGSLKCGDKWVADTA